MGIFDQIKHAIFNKAEAAESQAAESVVKAAAGSATAAGSVDVGAILDKAAAASGQRLNWQTSIVDLMKALKMDSSLSARKELASELNYTGDVNDSATMNVWLHQELMKQLEANGGKIPANLRA